MRRFVPLAATVLALAACRSSNPYRGMSDQEIYDQALRQFQDGDYRHCINGLNHLNFTFGNSKLLPDAQLLLARADYEVEDYLTAFADYQAFQQRYPSDPRAAEAGLGACRSMAGLSPIPQRDQTYTVQALAACRNVVADYPGSAEATEASAAMDSLRDKLAEKEYRDADFYLRRNLYDSAIKYFEFVVSDYPESSWAPKALLGVYRANMTIGYDDLAEQAKQRLIDRYPDSEEAKSFQGDGPPG